MRDLRYHFPEIEAWLSKGEELVVHKRQRMIARLLPILPRATAYPDFSALRRQIFGAKKVRKTGTDLASEERGRY